MRKPQLVVTRSMRLRGETLPSPVLSIDAADPVRPALSVVQQPTGWVKPSPHRVRKPGKRQLAHLEGSLTQFGICRPILVTRDGEMIDGHAVLEACKKLGLTSVPVIIIDDLTDAQIRALRLVLNKTPEMGVWDEAALKLEFEFLFEAEPELTFFTGFEAAEIDGLLAFVQADDVIPPVTTAPVSRLGDLWLCGNHAVFCGSASDPKSYEPLLGDERAQLLFTDPPYGCKIKGHVSRTHDEFVEGSGLDSDEIQSFFEAFLEQAKTRLSPGSLVYLFIDGPGMRPLLNALCAQTLKQKGLCVWDKQSGGMGSLYRNQAEFVVVAKYGDAPHINNVQLGRFKRTRTTVWSYPGLAQFGSQRDASLAIHPTVKPVALVADAILDASDRNGLVLDPFLGSGTTLVAAHRTHRRGRGIELDPKFVDVAVKRIETAVGAPARLAGTQLTFADVAAERQRDTAKTFTPLKRRGGQ